MRARISKVLEAGLDAYGWSSYPFYIRGKRPAWLRADRVLSALDFIDAPSGRRGYREYMAGRASEVAAMGKAGKNTPEWKNCGGGGIMETSSFVNL